MAMQRVSRWAGRLGLLALVGLTGCASGSTGRVPGAPPMGPGNASISIAQAPGARPPVVAPAPAGRSASAPLAPVAPLPPVAPPAPVRPKVPGATPRPNPNFDFRFAVGDELEVSVWNEKELTTTHRVMRDGTVPAKAVGNVPVVGRTIDEVHTDLTARYADFLVDPRVSIRILSIWSDRVFVVGEVAKPTAIPMPGKMTVMEAITQAGGFNAGIADMKTVRIVRKTTSGRPQIITVNADAVIRGQRRMTLLRPGDLVFVHPTGLADWSRRLNQILSPIGSVVGSTSSVVTAATIN